ncbi:MAG: flagellar biosynthetic protein FliR [Ignavibacteriaceae bacterium]
MTDILVADFVTILLIFMRVFAALYTSPVFGHKSIPVISLVGLVFIISYIVFLSSNMPEITGNISLWFLFINSIKEIITGIIIGFSIHIIFWGISYAGTLIGFDMGLSMAQVMNPMEQVNNNVIGELIYTASILLFFIINGHHYFIQALVSSFDLVPLGKFTVTEPVIYLLIKYGAGVFIIAVKIASPFLVSFFLVHLSEGIIARVIPQMQVFFVTQPVKIALGLSMLIAIIPIYIFVIKNLLKSYEDNLYQLVKAMGT